MVFVGCLWHNAGVRLRELLKLLGAGLTGGLIAARLQQGRKRYREYLLVRQAVANELRHQFHTVTLQALHPGITPQRASEWGEILRGNPAFSEEVAFLRDAVPDFPRRVGEALERLVRLAFEGNLAPATRRRMAPDLELYNRAVVDILQRAGELAGEVLGMSLALSREKGGVELLQEVSRRLREEVGISGAEFTSAAVEVLGAVDDYLDRLERD
ncbi:MAG: hypothetical protein Kow00109_10440 [Acidobacteriota bacterium]